MITFLIVAGLLVALALIGLLPVTPRNSWPLLRAIIAVGACCILCGLAFADLVPVAAGLAVIAPAAWVLRGKRQGKS